MCSYELLPQCKQRMAACLPFRVASVCCLAAGDIDSDIPMSQAGSRSLPAALAAAAATAAVIPPLPAGNKNGSSAHSARPAASVLSDHNHNLACLPASCLPAAAPGSARPLPPDGPPAARVPPRQGSASGG